MTKIPRSLLYQLLGFLLIAAVLFAAGQFLPVAQSMDRVQRHIGEMGPAGALLYPLLYAAFNVLLLPGGILSVGGGFFFGLWYGFVIVLTGSVLGSAIAFLIARSVARKWVVRYVQQRPRWAALDRAVAKQGWKIIFLSQLNPLFPTSLISYFYGITQVGFWHCMLWISLGKAPGIFLYTYIGTLGQISVDLWRGDRTPVFLDYITWGGGLILTLVLTLVLGQMAHTAWKAAGAEDGEQDEDHQQHQQQEEEAEDDAPSAPGRTSS